jgi:hypothetical protein
VTGTPFAPVPVQKQVQAWPVDVQPLALHEYIVSSDPHADSPQPTVTGTLPRPAPVQEQLHRSPVQTQPLALHEYVV